MCTHLFGCKTTTAARKNDSPLASSSSLERCAQIGPGYYDLPSLLDEHSVTIAASSERFQDGLGRSDGFRSDTVGTELGRSCMSCGCFFIYNVS